MQRFLQRICDGFGKNPGLNEKGRPVLIPFYEQINQTGLDIQMVSGSWLWKLEALYRTGPGDAFYAGTGGFEYAWVNIALTGMDLGFMGEWAYDERGQGATTQFQNDAIVGLRLAVNDAASSQFLVGFSQDLENHRRFLSIEASRRFGDNWLLSIESRAFFDLSQDDLLYGLRNDDYLQVELAYYF